MLITPEGEYVPVSDDEIIVRDPDEEDEDDGGDPGGDEPESEPAPAEEGE